MDWEYFDEFVVDPLSGYAPWMIDIWVKSKTGFNFDNLYAMRITQAENQSYKIVIGYNSDKFNKIELYRKKGVKHGEEETKTIS